MRRNLKTAKFLRQINASFSLCGVQLYFAKCGALPAAAVRVLRLHMNMKAALVMAALRHDDAAVVSLVG